MSDLLNLLGKANVEHLADVVGGRRLRIPKHPGKPPNGGRDGLKRLTLLVGDELALLLIFHFGDSTIYVPRPKRAEPVDPKAVARLTRRGLSVPEIVVVLGCAERTVFKHRARTRTGSHPKTRKAERKRGPA